MKEKTKINIIGGGLGGLVCAAYLSKNGFEVKLFEKLPVVGGVLNTFKKMIIGLKQQRIKLQVKSILKMFLKYSV